MSMSNHATAANLTTLLDQPMMFEDDVFRVLIPDPERVSISLLRSTPDSDLWMVGPVSVTRTDDDGTQMFDTVVLIITILDGPEHRVWAMDPAGAFACYWEA